MFDVGRFTKLGAAAIAAGLVSVASASAATYNFDCFNGNCGTDLSGQLSVTVTDVGGTAVSFLFNNAVGIDSSVTRIAFSDPPPDVLGGFQSLENSGGATFAVETTPTASIPGWGGANPGSINSWVELYTEADHVDTGLDRASRSVEVKFSYLSGKGIGDILGALESKSLLIGLQVQSIGTGGVSAQYQNMTVPIPLPATGVLMLGLLGVGALAANRKRKQKAA